MRRLGILETQVEGRHIARTPIAGEAAHGVDQRQSSRRWGRPGAWRYLVRALVVAAVLELGTMAGYPSSPGGLLVHFSAMRLVVFLVVALMGAGCAYAHAMPAPHCGANRHRIPALRELALRLGLPLGIALGSLAASVLVASDWRLRLLVFVVALGGGLLVSNRDVMRSQQEWAFLVLSLCCGTLTCVYLPSYANMVWDGGYHFEQALALSYVVNPQFTPADRAMSHIEEPDWASMLPRGSDALEGMVYDAEGLGLHAMTLDETSLARVDEAMVTVDNDVAQYEGTKIPSNVQGNTVLTSYMGLTTVGHLPLACGLWVGRLLHLPQLMIYLTGRLFSMAFYCIMFFLGARRLRSGKLVFCTLGLLPLSVLLASSYSYDSWTICLVSYSIARYVGDLQREQEPDLRESLDFLAPFLLGALVKAVVFPLGLVFLVGVTSMRDARRRHTYIWTVVATALVLVLSFMVPYLVSSGANYADVRGGDGVNPSGQVAWILEHPLGYAKVLGSFLWNRFRPGGLVASGIVFDDDYLMLLDDVRQGDVTWTYVVGLVAMCLIDRSEADEPLRGWRGRLLVLVAVGLSATLICTALYVGYNSVGYLNDINGVQTRYFISLLAPLLLMVINPRVQNVMGEAATLVTWLLLECIPWMLFMYYVFVMRF